MPDEIPEPVPAFEPAPRQFVIIENADGTFSLVVLGSDGQYYEMPVTPFTPQEPS